MRETRVISSVPLSVALTVLFALSGGYSLLRWASLRAGVAGHHGDPVAELSHLLMSLGMIAMVWAYGGSTGNAVQLVAYLALSGYFLTRLRRGGVAGHPGCPAPGFHLLMSGSMVWMVAAMPLLMAGMTMGSGGGMQMDGMTMGGDTGPATPSVTTTPGWAVALTWVFIAGLVAGAGFWLRRVLPARPAASTGVSTGMSTTGTPTGPSAGAAPATSAIPTTTATTGSAPTDTATTDTATTDTATTDTATSVTAISVTAISVTAISVTAISAVVTSTTTGPANRLLAALTPRADAACHLAMSLGMAAMFLAML
jgi:Domain of unknown function (DUF5134)